jgi:dynein heavy chain
MHDNATITSAINFTNEILSAALTQLPRETKSTGKSQDEVLDETATEILGKLPQLFDVELAAKKHPLKFTQSLNTVLQQEILRFNRLLKLVRDSLKSLKQAIKGEVVMSPDLESVAAALFDNRIPEMWMKRSYPSLKPLASYIVDFAARLKFIQDWIDNNAPKVFWMSGFYFTQSFLTGLKQDFARKYTIAIDKIEFMFEVCSNEKEYDFKKNAPEGAFVDGLFIEGCRWDEKMGVLAESHPKVLLTKMPKMWIKPESQEKINHGHVYECPLYKTLERFGTLSTTGHSTNFVVETMLSMQQKHT